jgi:RNA polymerase sigma-B factor
MGENDLTGLVRRYHGTGDTAARARAIELSLPLVRSIARRFAGRGEPFDDLVQVGTIGVIKAVDRFDPARGCAFVTYATPTVIGEIKRHFRDHGWDVRVPRGLQELIVRLAKEEDRLAVELGRAPTVVELSGSLGVDEELLLEAMQAGRAYNASAVALAGQDDEESQQLLDQLGETDPGYERSEERALLRKGLTVLDRREIRVLALRFNEGRTQSEIAHVIGCSQMHVSRIERAALEKMRTEIMDANLERLAA